MNHDVPVQSLIDHIKTAMDVDPWAKEMAEELLKKQEPRVMTSSELQPDDLVWIEVPQSDEIWPALLRKKDWFGYPTIADMMTDPECPADKKLKLIGQICHFVTLNGVRKDDLHEMCRFLYKILNDRR